MEIKNMRPNERALSPLPLSLPLGFRSSAFGLSSRSRREHYTKSNSIE
jgi:hypothetical protein